jgi:hypothetical protein
MLAFEASQTSAYIEACGRVGYCHIDAGEIRITKSGIVLVDYRRKCVGDTFALVASRFPLFFSFPAKTDTIAPGPAEFLYAVFDY